MKNKHLAIVMALIMCFSLVFGAAAATEGEQVIPTSTVSPTHEKDFIDKLPDKIPSDLQTTIGEIGSDIMDGAQEAHSFLATMQRIVDTVKVFFANLINTIFPLFNIGMNDSLFG